MSPVKESLNQVWGGVWIAVVEELWTHFEISSPKISSCTSLILKSNFINIKVNSINENLKEEKKF